MTTRISLYFGQHTGRQDAVSIHPGYGQTNEWVEINSEEAHLSICIFCDPDKAQEFAAKLNAAFDVIRRQPKSLNKPPQLHPIKASDAEELEWARLTSNRRLPFMETK